MNAAGEVFSEARTIPSPATNPSVPDGLLYSTYEKFLPPSRQAHTMKPATSRPSHSVDERITADN